ncbi:hypothetical protein BDV95DRAFT_70783 [Massariosphaeria phaeospora]|uniref:Heterokaryon incompatibility domain-containing protein n=1 Tax=Massariosphaeria phaeospora TaxID=100035 RepID=A0A7C8M9A7_9PLEO|nr:hypothetical protein BDV95DRAFT_70783 [Massariosphaeria phaeospora]
MLHCFSYGKVKEIQMMGQIYSSAKGVEVWLGACPSALSPWMSELQTSPPKRTVPDKGLSERPDLAITAMYLLTRRWFQRLWVVQETCLARDIRFLLGEHELSQQALTAAIEWIGIASTPDALSRHTFGFRRFWGYHLKQVPALLESRENFKNGQQWPLHQWLEMVKGRKATELKDYVYAGLALIQPGHLAIDTGLQLSEERPCTPRATRNIHESELKVQEKLPLTKRRLWPGLRADIDADATEVFLNLAACILSQPRGIDILTMSARFRDPKMLNNFRNQRADKTTGLLELPSWIPNPSSLSSRVLDPLKDLAASEFTACTHLPNSARISADGTTLYIDAAELGKIDLVVETPWYFQDAWKFLLKMEGTHGPSGQTYLKDLANALVLGPRNETFPTPDDTLRALVLCFYNDINATWESRKKSEERYHYNIPSAKSTRDREKLELDLRRLQEFMLQLETEYETLKSRYPDQEWPELGEALNDKDILLLQKYTGIRDRTRWWRTLFTTTSGYLGMGPPWLRAGDVVMLVKGGSVPYAFTHWDEERRRRLQWYERGEEGGRARRKRTKKYKAAIEECRNSIGEADAWILVGEAYVEGFMVGEAVDPDFKRIAVV